MSAAGRSLDRDYDVLVIGGGINGAAIARDAALRGLKVLLVEKGDYASGTSSKSSKLIHGGLRYLEHYKFGLVKESLHERALLLDSAPHLVRRLPFVFPVLPEGRPRWMLSLGFVLYDWLADRQRHFERHRALDFGEVQGLFPGLKPSVTAGFRYFDAQMDDARLVVENIIAAERAGAVARNYCELLQLQIDGGHIAGALLRDERSGCELELKTRCVVQASGAWTRDWDGSGTVPRVAPSKGTHIVLPSFGFDHALTLPVPGSQRIFFVIPWHGRSLVGTTDDNFEGAPDSVEVSAAEVEFLLSCVRYYLPERELGPEQVLGAFAGLRPLLAHEGSSAAASREHEIRVSPSGLITVSGGKYTTYRAIAEQVVDKIPGSKALCATRHVPLSAPAEPLATPRGLSAEQGERIAARYGHRASEVLSELASAPDGMTPLADGVDSLAAEVDYAVRSEGVRHIDDWLVRRTVLAWTRADAALTLAEPVSRRMAPLLGWSESERNAEVERYQQLAERMMPTRILSA